MSELYWMVSITDRDAGKRLIPLYKKQGLEVTLRTAGAGTAVSETLDYLGLERTEKVVVCSVVTGDTWKQVKKSLQNDLHIDVPGTGIAFTIPIGSVGGKKQLQYLTENQNFIFGEESTLKDTTYELLVVIANQGYSDLIMQAARSQNAGGGTVIHAKGTGQQRAEKFFGVSLVDEKEMVWIVVRREQKNDIMRAIMEQAGMDSKAKSIVFSLPVTATAGMRLMEEESE